MIFEPMLQVLMARGDGLLHMIASYSSTWLAFLTGLNQCLQGQNRRGIRQGIKGNTHATKKQPTHPDPDSKLLRWDTLPRSAAKTHPQHGTAVYLRAAHDQEIIVLAFNTKKQAADTVIQYARGAFITPISKTHICR